MARKVLDTFEFSGITVEIGPAIPKDAGLVVVAQNIRGSAWFAPLVDRVLAAMAASPKRMHGFCMGLMSAPSLRRASWPWWPGW